MRSRRRSNTVLHLTWILGIWLGLSSIAFASDALLAIPPFKGSTQYPALLSGLQQMVIDDLRSHNKEQVLSRLEVQTSLKRLGRRARTPVYIREVLQLQNAFRAKWVLINTFNERGGFFDWRLQLVDNNTGSVTQDWTFGGPLSDIFRMQNKVVSTLETALSLSTQSGPAQFSTSSSEDRLSALMAYSQGLEAFDDYEYVKAITQFRAAHDHNKSFPYTARQLNLVRSTVKDSVTSPRELGLFWLADGDAKQAQGYLQDALSQHPEDVEVMLALNRIEAKRNRHQAARKLASRAQAIAGHQPQPWIELGKVAQAENKPREALDLFEQAQSRDPKNAEVQLRIGDLYEQINQPAKAAQAYREAGTLYGKTLQTKKASSAISKAKQLSPKDVAVLMAEGNLFKQAGQPQKAQKSYQKAHQLSPKTADPLQQLAKLQKDLGSTEAAFRNLETALDIEPTHVDANVQMAQLHLDNGEHEQAAVFLQRATQGGKINAGVGKALGAAYAGSGKLDAAAKEFGSVLKLAPNDAGLISAYADVLKQQGNFPEAQTQYEKALKLNPDAADVYKNLGLVQQQQGQVAEAKFAFNQAKRIAPTLELPTIKAPDVQQEFRQLSSSFPEIQVLDHATKVAFIDSTSLYTQSWLNTARAFVSDYGKLYRADTRGVFADFQKSLKHTYVFASPQRVTTALASAPFHVMTLDDLSNSTFLVALCEALKVDALMFYRITPKPRTDAEYPFHITALLFEKATESRWVNETTISYPPSQATMLNLPLAIGLAVIGAVLFFWLIIYLSRGSGNLKVIIEQDEQKKKAVFSVIISKKANKDLTKVKSKLLKKSDKRSQAYKYDRKVNFAKKYERYLVLSETLFEKIHAGQYYVYLYGIIPDGRGGQMGNYQTTQRVTIQKNRSQETIFDFRTTTRQVDIQVFDGSEAAIGAEVTIKGQGESRYLKEAEGISFHLSAGTFTVLIHYNGKLFNETIEIPDLMKDYHFSIDLPEAEAPPSNRPTIPPPIEVVT